MVLADRLWLSAVPHSIRDNVGALLIVRASATKQYGSLSHGSVLQGRYATLQWIPGDDGHGQMRLLQDNKATDVRITNCTPSDGFDYCIVIHGDPQGVGRYESRRLWGLRKPHKSITFNVAQAIAEVAEQDPELAALMAEQP